MKKRYDYAWEKFHNAVSSLATSTESLQERLLSVFLYNFMPMHEDDIPPRMRGQIGKITAALFHKDDSPRIPSDDEATQLLESIVDMYSRLCKYGPSDDDDEAV